MFNIEGANLEIQTKERAFSVDLTRVLRVTLRDLPVTRSTSVNGFEVRGTYPLANGLRVDLANLEHGLIIPVSFLDNESGFRVVLHAGMIVEQLGINRRILEIALLQDLLTSRVGDDGFFLLPCFTGTLVRFKDHPPTVNRDRIYTAQREWEKTNLLNCFAMNRDGEGTLAVVHRGDFACEVVTEVNQDGTNRIYPVFRIRRHEAEMIKQEDKEVIYRILDGNDANYVGMAKAYRAYLLNERGVSPLKERVADNPVLAYSVGAMRTKIMHGLKPATTRGPDGFGDVQVDTTFEEAGRILDEMQAQGIKKSVVTLVGWNLGGHDGAYPTRFPVEPAFGGEEGLRALIEKAKAMGYQIVPHDNVTDIYRSAPDYDPEYVARTEHGEPVVVGVWAGGQSYKACPQVYLERWGYDLTRIRELGFEGHYYLDAQASVLWSCHDSRHPADEEAYALSLARIAQWPRTIYGAISVEFAPAYTLPFVDEVAWLHFGAGLRKDIFFDRCPQEFLRIADRVVPFYLIALHGLVTYHLGWMQQLVKQLGTSRKAALMLLGHGARPCMEVNYRGNRSGDSIPDLVEAYRLMFEETSQTLVQTIEAFEELSPTATRITYSCGTTITSNWGDEPVAGLAADSYEIRKTEET